MAANRNERVTRWFLGLVGFGALVYAGLGLSPSSYGSVFRQLGAESAGPIAGAPRDIRSDEWAMLTPQFQMAVRNGFRRINDSSFYREDLRNYEPLPLKDWSLIFKPQLWAFFILPPGSAFSIYFAFFMAAFLAGLYLLFRELGAPAAVSIAAAFAGYFSGFSQFWWTTFLPVLALYPWVLLLTLRPMAFWKKALIGAWLFPVFLFSHAYPPILLTMAWCAIFLILAFRPSLLRSPGELAALALSLAITVIAFYAYMGGIIAVMSNTVHPGHRVAPSGTTPLAVVMSQIFPFFSFQLSGFENLTGQNICEIGAVGSFLPLLTLFTTRYRDLRKSPATLRALAILLSAFAAITLWEVAPVPAWIGSALRWNSSVTARWLFASGFLLTAACLVLWRDGLVSLTRGRVALFSIGGLAASVACKLAWWAAAGDPVSDLLSNNKLEVVLIFFAVLTLLAMWPAAAQMRAPVVLGVIALVNICAFGRFNPLQPARPIFAVPDSPELQRLRAAAAASPDGVLREPAYLGSILNGIGFRSVNHYLLAPEVQIFRRYFPNMDPDRFNRLFNRSSYIQVIDGPLPLLPSNVMIQVPVEVFIPVRNVRRLDLSQGQAACEGPAAGAIERITERNGGLVIDGWAPWRSENPEDGLRVVSARALRTGSLTTVTRPDIAEALQDYRMVKAGFRLEIASADGKPLHAADIALIAFGPSLTESRIRGGSCR